MDGHETAGEDRRIEMILVDDALWLWRDRRWAHLVSDTSYDELHDFAAQLGLRRMAFQGDHYDIVADARPRAVELGAVPVGVRDLVRRLRAAGLRRRHDRDGLRWRPAGSLVLPNMSRDVTIEVLHREGELAVFVDRGGAEVELVIPLAQLG